MLRHQSHQPLSIVVGLHGVQPTPRFAESVERIAEALPTVVLDFPGRISLGECLNRAIDATGAEILAKIDDELCMGCGVCVAKCPQHALALELAPEKGEPLILHDLLAATRG